MKILGAFIVFLSVSQSFAASTFDRCVSGLYGSGGLSLREAQEACLHNDDPATVTCQNNLFQKAFQTPQESLATCSQDKKADQFYQSGDLYHGIYADIPNNGKKNVCTITVNSEEERQSFKKILPAADYNFVELLPAPQEDRFITRDSAWLQRSCQAQVHCDVLVISGHFAESFLGEKGFEISINDFINYKQKSECQNFFSSIKEVYLFGCNTLATKNQDSRSIQEYISVLVEDGVAPHTAQRIAARRYTSYDESVSQKMKNIFSSADFITGFPSVGPSGKSVQGTLEKYLANAYQEGRSLQDRKAEFAKTLRRLGMIMVTSQGATKNLLAPVNVNLNSADSVLKYVAQYGSVLVIPSVDLVSAAKAQNLLSPEQIAQAKQILQTAWQGFSANQKRKAFCPLKLADEQEWIPGDLDCENNLDWMYTY